MDGFGAHSSSPAELQRRLAVEARGEPFLVHHDADGAENQGYAIGIDRVASTSATLRDGRSIGWTGASFTPLSSSGGGQSLMLAGAVPGSAADQAGLGSRPVLLRGVNGRTIDPTIAGYCDAVAGLRSGAELTLSVREVTRTATGAYALGDSVPSEVRVKLE